MSELLKGKVAIVSGASSGIGAAIARELSSQGAHVVINYPFPSEQSRANKVLESLEGKAKSIAVEADISTTTGPIELVERTVREFGHIDIVVNNAGISSLIELDAADEAAFLQTWNAVVNTNARGTLLLTRAALKHLSKTNSRIVNICSAASRNPEPHMSIYSGSKGMIESFTRTWARELPRKYGCTVNAVAPGPVSTEAVEAAPPEIQKMLHDSTLFTPTGPRMAKPYEIAYVVAMLCHEKASWVNGAYIPVSGGMTLS